LSGSLTGTIGLPPVAMCTRGGVFGTMSPMRKVFGLAYLGRYDGAARIHEKRGEDGYEDDSRWHRDDMG